MAPTLQSMASKSSRHGADLPSQLRFSQPRDGGRELSGELFGENWFLGCMFNIGRSPSIELPTWHDKSSMFRAGCSMVSRLGWVDGCKLYGRRYGLTGDGTSGMEEIDYPPVSAHPQNNS